MKTALDPRHKRRRRLIEDLFRRDFHDQPIGSKAKSIFAAKDEIDKKIASVAPEFPIEKINKIDLAILRLAMYELFYERKTPPKVIVDEAIELAKEYGGDNSPAFINGALGRILKDDQNTIIQK
jgi:N utilization substance protein B